MNAVAERPLERHFDRVDALEREIADKLPVVEPEYAHHFAHGLYGREMRVPAHTVVTGKIHKRETLNILLDGVMVLVTENGRQTIRAPAVVVSGPGTRRAAYTLTACRWLTVHGTAERDLDAIEREFVAQSPAEFFDHAAAALAAPVNEDR